MTPRAATPVFSVVVPTVGRARRLDGCLGALARLDYPADRFEVVVVNDGGGGEIVGVVARWAERLDVDLVSTRSAGPSAARNAGAQRSRGRYLAFTDDDCEPDPGWLAALEPVLEANPKAAVGGEVGNGALGRCAAGSQAVLDATHAYFNRDRPSFFASNNIAFHADGYGAVGGFDESILHAEDRELCERWLRSGGHLVHAPGALVRHMRELTARQFWRQHFGYGRGAWAVHRARPERGWGRFTVEPGFYAELTRQARRPRNGAGRASLATLAIVSQVANAAGFAREALAAGRRTRAERGRLGEVSR